jgi:hypothetical protein
MRAAVHRYSYPESAFTPFRVGAINAVNAIDKSYTQLERCVSLMAISNCIRPVSKYLLVSLGGIYLLIKALGYDNCGPLLNNNDQRTRFQVASVHLTFVVFLDAGGDDPHGSQL